MPAALDGDVKLVFAVIIAICLGVLLQGIQTETAPAASTRSIASATQFDLVGTTTWRNSAPHQAHAQEIAAIPPSPMLGSFDLAAETTQIDALPAETARTIQAAIDQIEKRGECSLLFLDMATGKGFAYQPERTLYGASIAKAPMAYYALAVSPREFPEAHRSKLEASIVASDNDSFFDYGYPYFDQDYIDWLSGYGVEHSVASGDVFLSVSARSIAAIWADIADYLGSSDADAAWLASLFGQTNASFIRDGLTEYSARVLNKGGWIAERLCSTSDAGIVEAAGRRYLVAIVTSQPDSGAARKNVSDLAAALYEQRGLLQ